jgi:hypothetical protein
MGLRGWRARADGGGETHRVAQGESNTEGVTEGERETTPKRKRRE